MGILNKLREKARKRSERNEQNREIGRYAEEARLTKLAEKEGRELEQDERIAGARQKVLATRQKKRELNPGFFAKLTSGSVSGKKHGYSSVSGETKKRGSNLFGSIAQHGGNSSAFRDSLGLGRGFGMGSEHPRSKHKKGKVRYVKKGKKYIKVREKPRHESREHERSEHYDPIWGSGGGI